MAAKKRTADPVKAILLVASVRAILALMEQIKALADKTKETTATRVSAVYALFQAIQMHPATWITRALITIRCA
jgi:hypothetical protein